MGRTVIGCAYVIGGAGFIGRRLVDSLLADGQRVVVVDPLVLASDVQHPNARSIASTVTDPLVAAIGIEHPTPTVVYHLGGSGSVGAAAADPTGDEERTVRSTERLLRRLGELGGGRVVLSSSAAVYGETEADAIREDTPLAPISVYGRNKALAERVCLEAASSGLIDASVVRLFSVYGAGLRKQLLWEACGRMLRGELEFGGSGQEVRDWLHVDDAVALLRTVAKASTSPLIVNGGSGVGTRVDEILRSLARDLSVTAPLRFSGVVRPGDPMRMVADIGRARSLGWQPRRVLAEGLTEYARWFEGRAC